MHVVLQRELDLKFIESFFWSDSASVLKYIRNESSRFKTFVAKQISLIREVTSPEQWGFVNSCMNPADKASRGMKLEDPNPELWFQGPHFLHKPESEWPVDLSSQTNINGDDSELKKVTCAAFADDTPENALGKLMSYLKDFLRWKATERKRIDIGLSIDTPVETERRSEVEKDPEMFSRREKLRNLEFRISEKAECILLQGEQQHFLSEEFNRLASGKTVKRSSQLYKLGPFVENGLIRVGGRLENAQMPYDAKHPIVVPKLSTLVEKLIRHTHVHAVGHLGKNAVLSHLRQNYWVIRANRILRKLMSPCVNCIKYKGRCNEQKMANLLPERLAVDPPFTHTGVDYFGPFEVKRGRTKVKRYGVLLTCLSSRAIHLEVAESYGFLYQLYS
ncbi:uncharacterized protein LOC141902151 [Tubulanus polymorphus]|uniref:uncharacterized protein LOC141902151 n=1 Tax=Tubulanus polymorphus TaxID=672921 RepID=UPI003DA62BE3